MTKPWQGHVFCSIYSNQTCLLNGVKLATDMRSDLQKQAMEGKKKKSKLIAQHFVTQDKITAFGTTFNSMCP